MKLNREHLYDLDMLLFGLLAILLIMAAVLRPVIPYDTIAYHLPFGAKLAHVDKAEDFFLYDGHHLNAYVNRFLGFPLFPYYIHGYLFRIFGSMRSLAVMGAIPLIMLTLYARKLFNIDRSLFLVLCLTAPLVAIHAHSSYVDLLCGSLIAALALITIRSLSADLPFRQRCRDAVAFIILSFLCGQTKFFTLPFVYPLALICALAAIFRCKERKQWVFLGILFSVAVFAAALKLLSNWIYLQNPFYPIATSLFNGPEPDWSGWSAKPGYAEFLGPLARPIYFICSITELDLLLRGIRPLYTVIDSAGTRDAMINAAGFGFINAILFLVWQAFYYIRRKHKDETVDNTLKVLLGLLAVNALLPQSHVLRYWMYIPLLAAFLVLLQLRDFNTRIKTFFWVGAICVFLVNNAFLTQDHFRLLDFTRHPNYPLPVREIQDGNPAYVCTGDNVVYPLFFSTILSKGDWKTNPPECGKTDDACRYFVNYVGTELVIRKDGCAGNAAKP